MEWELLNNGYKALSQYPISVSYHELKVGQYNADLIVEEKLISEVKAASNLCEEYEYQLINYLKATDIEIGLLLNFGKKPQFAHKIFQNQ